jgi:hypothetical protein
MRWHFKVLIVVVTAIVGLNLATTQAQLPLGLGAMGGLLSKDARPDPLQLLHNASVKKELRLTEDQLNKVDAAVWEALGKVLTADQFRRLKEIDLQQRDYLAFGDVSVQERLKLTKDQKASIKTILSDADKEMNTFIKELTSGAGGFAAIMGMRDKVTAIGKETKDRCTEVLTPEQRRTWIEMVGDDFKLEMPKVDIPFPDLGVKKGNVKKKGGGE